MTEATSVSEAQLLSNLLAQHPAEPAALLPVLHAVQDELGFIPPALVPGVAKALGLSRAEVFGVISYYKHFRQSPPGRHLLRLCRAEACQAVGGEALHRHAQARCAGADLTLEDVYCLGLCACGPALQVDETELQGKVSAEAFDALLARLERECSAPDAAPDDADRAEASRAEASTMPERAQPANRTHPLPAGGGRGEGFTEPERAQPANRTHPLPAGGGRGEGFTEPEPEQAQPVNPTHPLPPEEGGEKSHRPRVWLSQDAAALALGAEAVAQALRAEAQARGIALELLRPGSHGAVWLEPLLEVEVRGQRIAYGPVSVAEIPALFAAGFLEGGTHPLRLGKLENLSWFAGQTRRLMRRSGWVDAVSLADYLAQGGGAGLARARAMAPPAIVAEISASGLRGRGGAGFPAGIKWRTVQETTAAQKYVVCNADEGDSGTFADRMLMEGDPFALFEGMAIAGRAVGATRGVIYVRSEYPQALATLRAALNAAGDWLEGFHISLFKAGGSYVCGEETALLESLEGRRGQVRAKPPLPAVAGLFGQPTLVHNVLTLASVPDILATGAADYAALGSGRSRGTLAVQLAGNIRRGGLVEVPFGLPLRQLLEDYGGGSRSGRPWRAVQVGGPLGAYLPASQFDTPLDYEAFAAIGATLGHGGIVAFDDSVNMAAQARFAFAFCAAESCGKCTPCRIGAVRGVELIDEIRAGRKERIALVEDLCDTLSAGSLCAMGGMTPNPVRSALRHFAEDFS